MRYVACQNADCINRGAPYAAADSDVYLCPLCTKAMETVEPDLTPPAPPAPPAPPTPEEDLASARGAVAGQIALALSGTDLWAIRHVEDGKSLTPERIAYRQELRTLLDSAATSDDPASIEIPDPPPPPKT